MISRFRGRASQVSGLRPQSLHERRFDNERRRNSSILAIQLRFGHGLRFERIRLLHGLRARSRQVRGLGPQLGHQRFGRGARSAEAGAPGSGASTESLMAKLRAKAADLSAASAKPVEKADALEPETVPNRSWIARMLLFRRRSLSNRLSWRDCGRRPLTWLARPRNRLIMGSRGRSPSPRRNRRPNLSRLPLSHCRWSSNRTRTRAYAASGVRTRTGSCAAPVDAEPEPEPESEGEPEGEKALSRPAGVLTSSVIERLRAKATDFAAATAKPTEEGEDPRSNQSRNPRPRSNQGRNPRPTRAGTRARTRGRGRTRAGTRARTRARAGTRAGTRGRAGTRAGTRTRGALRRMWAC